MATARTLLRRAIDRDQLFEFLEGRENYRVDYSALVINPYPTDFRLVVRTINSYHPKHQDDNLPQKLIDALNRCLAEDTLFDLYCAFSIVYYHLNWEGKGKAAFELDRPAIMPQLQEKILANREALMNYKDFEGCNEPNGAWTLVMQYNRKLRSEYGIRLLPDAE